MLSELKRMRARLDETTSSATTSHASPDTSKQLWGLPLYGEALQVRTGELDSMARRWWAQTLQGCRSLLLQSKALQGQGLAAVSSSVRSETSKTSPEELKCAILQS